ncbi:MAG: hypothetical protein RBU37_22760, partial [Myxococcota bacterium]|nr:hypothetical protein [Myxococcota bacterium]
MHSSSSLVELPNPGSEPRARLLPVGGKLLVLADYSGLRASMEKRELLEVIAEVRRLILADAQSKLVLTDASHTQTDGEVLAALKSLAKEANL